MLTLRPALPADIDFLADIDLRVDIEDEPDEPVYCDSWTASDYAAHREKIAGFVTDKDKGAWVVEDTDTGRPIGMTLCYFRDRLHKPRTEATEFLFRFIDESILPDDGRFCEIFQLWVDPAYRRRGLGSQLKQQAEDESRRRGIHVIYTHTRERNAGVIDLNRKLGYVEIRRGPMWDEAVRVSLVKRWA